MPICKKCLRYTHREVKYPLNIKRKLEKFLDKIRKERKRIKIEMIFRRSVTVILILIKIILNSKCKSY